jgi:hypothetical protein
MSESRVDDGVGIPTFKFKSIPPELLPTEIGTMKVTEELRLDYQGHESLLKIRARHSEDCQKHFDALRLCMLRRLDPDKCSLIQSAYAPCAKELRSSRLAREREQILERRKALNAKAKLLEAKDGHLASS